VTLLAHVAEERHGSLAAARVEGEIDASNVDGLEGKLRASLTNDCDGLAVDLSGTTYLDSAGIALLFTLASDLRRHQQQLRLVVVSSSPIARMVSLARLDAAVPTHPTLAAAVAEAGGRE